MRMSKRIEKLAPYPFVEISRRMAEKRAQGKEVISFGIGDPDMATPAHIIEKLCEQAQNPVNHRYPETEGLPETRKAIATWYKNRFDISLDPDNEVLPLLGSKEGVAHVSFIFIDPGDIALITDPGYPVCPVSTMLAGGESYFLPLLEKNDYLPDLDSIPSHVLKRAKLLWINYPNNPTAAVADLDFFNRVVKFAREHDLVVCHDAAYTEVSYDGYESPSLLQADGAKDVGVEFHSLSKTYNMTGWRIGMVVGNTKTVSTFKEVKANLDSGIPQAIQYAAIEALTGPQDYVQKKNAVYQRRRDLLVEVLNNIGLEAKPPKASIYVWAKVPEGYTSVEFTADLLDKLDVVVTPGTGFGKSGEGYVRLSLTIPDAGLVKGLSRLSEWRNTKTRLRGAKR